MTYRRIAGLVALVLTLTTAACDDGTDAPAPGTMSVMLTDATGDFNQAIVTIERVELVGDGEAVILVDEPFTTDLLTLSNDFAALVEDAVVPGGAYAQLRFIIPGACIEVEDVGIFASDGFDDCGTPTGDLQLPSFDSSGLKVALPGGAQTVDGDAYVVLVDFDVSESFGQLAGGSGMWVMHPVIKAEEFATSATITVELTAAEGVDLGTVGASLGDFQVRLESEETPQPFTDEDEDGTWTATFRFLLPDTEYDVSVPELQEGVTPFDFTISPDTDQPTTVGSGGTVVVSFEITEVIS
jgi:hypothetical protein